MATGWRKDYFRYKDFFLNIYNIYKRRQDLKAYLEILLSLITSSIFLAFALRPTVLTIVSLVKEIKSKEETIKIADQKIQNLGLAQSTYAKESSIIALIDQAVPTFPEPQDFTRQVEAISQRNGVNIKSLSFSEAVLAGNDDRETNKLEFAITTFGQYANLLAFIKDFESLRRPSVNSFSLSQARATSGEVENTITLVVNGSIPYARK